MSGGGGGGGGGGGRDGVSGSHQHASISALFVERAGLGGRADVDEDEVGVGGGPRPAEAGARRLERLALLQRLAHEPREVRAVAQRRLARQLREAVDVVRVLDLFCTAEGRAGAREL